MPCPTVDPTRTLAQLTGVDWGPPPPGASLAVRTRYEVRAKPLERWTHGELIEFIRAGADERLVVAAAIARLEVNPTASGTGSEAGTGALLCHVLESTAIDWANHPECVRRMRQIVGDAENQMFQIDDPWAQKTALLNLYRSHGIFEMRLSSIQ
jgi:hypothetical protein